VIFAGTPEFAATALKALIDSKHEVVAVLTQPDRPGGRGRKPRPSPVKELAQSHKIPVLQPIKLDADACLAVKNYEAQVMIVAAYGLMIPDQLLNWPQFGCINIHASLLPRWRGAAPIQRAILANDKETGITIMQMDAGLDTGDMLSKQAIDIHLEDNAQTLHDRLASLGASLLIETLALITQEKVNPEPQDDSQATYASKLLKEEGALDWSQSSEALNLQIRGLTPWPSCFTFLEGQRIKILAAQIGPNEPTNAKPGSLLSSDQKAIYVATGSGTLAITSLQLPGKKPTSAPDAVNGHPHWIEENKVFSSESQ